MESARSHRLIDVKSADWNPLYTYKIKVKFRGTIHRIEAWGDKVVQSGSGKVGKIRKINSSEEGTGKIYIS